MSSWANFYRGLANEAMLRAVRAADLSEKDKFEEVAREWSALAEWPSKSGDSPGASYASSSL